MTSVVQPELESFESAESGASHTYPQQAGTIRKNGFIVLNNRPCRVLEKHSAKTGKHGHAKCTFVGSDIFTGKHYTDATPSSHNCDVPVVSREEYVFIDITDDGDDDDGFVTLLSDRGTTREDMRLPSGTPEYDGIAAALRHHHSSAEAGDIVVTVLRAMGEEVIHSFRVVSRQ